MVQPASIWHVPVLLDDVPETGLHLDLTAGEEVRASLAEVAGITAMPRLEATLDVVRHGNGIRATGHVSATVEQTCVVTLEPVKNEVDEPFDVIFAPSTGEPATADRAEAALGGDDQNPGEPPEALSDGTADVGAIAAEFLLLGIDPYPRKPGAEFKPPAEQGAGVSPFAELSKLKNAKQ